MRRRAKRPDHRHAGMPGIAHADIYPAFAKRHSRPACPSAATITSKPSVAKYFTTEMTWTVVQSDAAAPPVWDDVMLAVSSPRCGTVRGSVLHHRIINRGNPDYFFQSRQAQGRLEDAVLEQRSHPGPPRGLADDGFVRLARDQRTQLVGDRQHLMNRDATFEARLRAGVATVPGDPRGVDRQSDGPPIFSMISGDGAWGRAQACRPPHKDAGRESQRRKTRSGTAEHPDPPDG